jgi:hypothetical protein
VELRNAKLNEKELGLAEKRVNLAINMSDVCVRISCDAVRDKYPKVREKELLGLVRRRIMYGKRRVRQV